MALPADDINTLIEGGNGLAGFTQALVGLASEPAGADQADAILGLSGALFGLLADAKNPFVQALGVGVGAQAGALGVVVAAVQLSAAHDDFKAALASGDEAARSAVQEELADKAIGVFTAVGGTMAAIPAPAIQQIGLAIWLGGTAAQQVMNGNARRALEIVGPEIADAIADLVGGASATVRQYVSGAGEVVTVERFDRHGISEGEHGVFTGKARVSFVTGDGTIVTEYQGESETPSDTWFEPHTKVTEEHLRMPAAPAQAWDLPRGPSAVADYDGNTVDYAVEMLEPFDVGYGELAQLLLGGSLAALYAETVDWFSHEGQWFIDGYGDIADQVGDAELLRLQQIELELGKGKGAEEREDRVAGGISSPIAIDLNGDGVQTVGFIHHDVPFDITGDGAPERTAWLSGSDGFVVHDKNRNGRVDGQVELFGGQDRGVGYAELSIFDSNGDRMVSSVDDRYAELMVWQDRNMDAQTDPGELRSLSDAGIDRLALDHVNVNRWQNGNLVGEASTAEVEGERREMADVYLFHVDSSPPAALSPEAMADLLIHAAAAMPPADGGARVAFPPNLHREPFPSLAVGA